MLSDTEWSDQENREKSMVAKNIPKISFQKSSESVDFQQEN